MTALRVAVADDSVLLREGLVRVLGDAGLEVVGAFGDAEALLAALPGLAADAVVLDVRMPPTFRDEGVRAAIEVRRRHPSVAILLLSQYVEVAYAQELLAAGTGGIGYLLKDRVISLDEVRDALERVAAGGTVLDPEVITQLMARRVDPLAALTAREREVLELMAQGRTNAAIAAPCSSASEPSRNTSRPSSPSSASTRPTVITAACSRCSPGCSGPAERSPVFVPFVTQAERPYVRVECVTSSRSA